MRDKLIQIRVFDHELEQIKANAGDKNVSEFLRDLGLGAGIDLDPKDVRAAVDESGLSETQVVEAGRLTKLVKQLEAQGNPDAEEVARKRLGM